MSVLAEVLVVGSVIAVFAVALWFSDRFDSR